ncbi:MAG: hypothetical protein LIO86_01960 [Lachnospiraceae bacterium]|nr:hypothetical protein [Lachnospiraceae bacterium]
MNNFDQIQSIIKEYLADHGVETEVLTSNLHAVSLDKQDSKYVYNGQRDLPVIDMDSIAQGGYKKAKNARDEAGENNIVNTADGFLVDQDDNWTFVEFKNSEIKAKKDGLKNSILKKAYANWYMLLDILYDMKQKGHVYPGFTYDQPMEFAQQHITFILVCSSEKNPRLYGKNKDCRLAGERYVPGFMQRLKDYLFLDAYVYTEVELEQKFVRGFIG